MLVGTRPLPARSAPRILPLIDRLQDREGFRALLETQGPVSDEDFATTLKLAQRHFAPNRLDNIILGGGTGFIKFLEVFAKALFNPEDKRSLGDKWKAASEISGGTAETGVSEYALINFHFDMNAKGLSHLASLATDGFGPSSEVGAPRAADPRSLFSQLGVVQRDTSLNLRAASLEDVTSQAVPGASSTPERQHV